MPEFSCTIEISGPTSKIDFLLDISDSIHVPREDGNVNISSCPLPTIFVSNSDRAISRSIVVSIQAVKKSPDQNRPARIDKRIQGSGLHHVCINPTTAHESKTQLTVPAAARPVISSHRRRSQHELEADFPTAIVIDPDWACDHHRNPGARDRAILRGDNDRGAPPGGSCDGDILPTCTHSVSSQTEDADADRPPPTPPRRASLTGGRDMRARRRSTTPAAASVQETAADARRCGSSRCGAGDEAGPAVARGVPARQPSMAAPGPEPRPLPPPSRPGSGPPEVPTEADRGPVRRVPPLRVRPAGRGLRAWWLLRCLAGGCADD